MSVECSLKRVSTVSPVSSISSLAHLLWWITYTMLYVWLLNYLVVFISDSGPWTLTTVQMKRHVLYFPWLHGVVPGILVSGCRSLDRTSMSQMLVSRLYTTSGGWPTTMGQNIQLLWERTAHARFLSDTRHCPMMTSKSVRRTSMPDSGSRAVARLRETFNELLGRG